MRLSRITISNHRRLVDVSIEVRKHLVLVGPNDVGKSSLLRCLDLLLGASTAQLYAHLGPEDFRDPDQPLVIEAELIEFSPADQGLFPDEISINPVTGEARLLVRLAASIDASRTLSVERTAPGGGTGRQLSREQLAGFGWKLLTATASSRDLKDHRRTVVHDILQSIDLGPEQADFDLLTDAIQENLRTSTILGGLREDLAGQLSRALPEVVKKDDLVFISGAAAENDPLSDVRLQIAKDGEQKNLTEQSDGMRALYAIALYDLVSVGANMVGIDEPELHLHPTSQRALARLLQSGPNQKLLATHSSDIVGAFEPECIVAVRAGGKLVQPAEAFLSDDERMTVRWWVRDKLEPLTALRVIGVEGISDRIILERVSDITDRNLDRLGVSLIETGGAGDMGAIIKLFGESGFNIPMSMLIDADAIKDTANKLAVAEADLSKHSVWVSTPDLEAEYVAALGAAAVWAALSRSSLFTANELSVCAVTGPEGSRTDQDVAGFCRSKSKVKVKAAMVIAPLLNEKTARKINSIDKLLTAIAVI
ncbi:ATP-dependent nuclease [Parafrankia sp. FMc2]|uniref:ATP-dependent nuclease n=1 Tax=Parafrankia sp. FMc2 TaxID=3233196 RepID=UPI0034D6CD1B